MSFGVSCWHSNFQLEILLILRPSRFPFGVLSLFDSDPFVSQSETGIANSSCIFLPLRLRSACPDSWKEQLSCRSLRLQFFFGSRTPISLGPSPTLDGRNPAPPRRPSNDKSPVNTNKRYGFPWFQSGAECSFPGGWRERVKPPRRRCLAFHRSRTATSQRHSEFDLEGSLLGGPLFQLGGCVEFSVSGDPACLQEVVYLYQGNEV